MRDRFLSKAGKRALVTGGARGIGQAYAVRLAADGADIVLIDQLDCTKTESAVRHMGRGATSYAANLADGESVEAVARRIVTDLGGCDILVNNAGIGSAIPFQDISHARLRHILAINLEAPFILCKTFLPGMRDRGWGRIVNISTATLNSNAPNFVDYVMSKGGIVGLTRGLASEVGADGVTVNAIAPGLVRTPLTELGDADHRPMPEQGFEAVRQAQSVPQTMMPDDLVGAMSFLASDDAAFVTGQVFHVDGGLTRA